MKRRTFLSSAIQAGIAAGLSRAAGAQTTESADRATEVWPALPPALIGPEAVEGYFTEERMYAALGTRELRKPADVEVIAYNFPSWHPSPYMEKHFGKGWTEFDALRNARPLFPGHSMPHYPLWGYYNEAEPEWAAKEIDLAATYGVDAWLVDWYWHEGTQFYQEQLEQGFLKADNRSKLKFAIMWANHDWKNVYPARSPDQAAILLPQTHTLADLDRVIEYCADHYFSQPNYFRIDDAPLFCIFDGGKLIEQLNADGAKQGLERMRERALKLGFPKLHLQVANGYDRMETQLHEFGFDSATQYGTFGWTYGGKPPGSRISYGVGAVEAIASWKQKLAKVTVPFHPCVSVGWDDSPRFEEFAAVAINRSPDQFERLVRAARHTVADAKGRKLIYIAAWNEWTEDHVLLPDTYWGYSYLEALRRGARG
ncbi:MAG TPA: glycoside hydrolase family 99-like domain-containing protein [Alloacidobacterium sp.]|nr:glycoside hydrolase family 99-like domain-containing protein [Alloacidobacterium sp.]